MGIPKERLIELFGLEWFKVLEEYISSKPFTILAATITGLRKTRIIYPSKELIFRAFTETPYNKVKTVLLGQDCYHDGSADGLCFSNSLTGKISPSLRLILDEISHSYPEWDDAIDYGRLDKQDLSRWAKQGVFLINFALTVEEGNPKSHLELWKPFITFVLSKLNEKREVIWILLGKESKKLESLITNTTHTILYAAHPAVHCYGGTGFLGSGVFKECNNELEARNKSIIQW